MSSVQRLFGLVAVSTLFVLTAMLLFGSTAAATQFQGTLYYTRSQGQPNVTSLGFTYDNGTHVLTYGTQHDIASLNGADGIMFAPNGNLLVTSNTTGLVYRLDRVSGQTLQSVSTGTPGFSDFHMALDPGRVQFYSSNSYYRAAGPLDTFGINPDGSINNATVTPIAGDNPNVTQLGFAPNGKVLYTDGNPNAFGSIGLFTFGAPNDVTTQLVAANQVRAAHGVIYDPYSGLWTMFGGGSVATMDPNASTNASIVASLKQSVQFVADFDQGAVDGFGHAFIAGANDITFLDYSLSHDITHPDQVIIRGADGVGDGFGNIDDLVPLIVGGPAGIWTGTNDANWATPGNWLGPVPGATTGTTNTDTATFNQNAPHSPLTIDAGRNLKNITFDTASVNSMIIGTTGGNALLLTADGTIQTTATVVNPQTVNAPLVLEGDYTFTSGAATSAAALSFGGRITPGASSGVTTLTLDGANTGANTISGVLADNGAGHLAVTMAGPGVWTLSGANTFSGSTTITGGKLVLKNSAALQMSTLSLSIDNGLAFASGLGSATLGGLTGSGKLALQDQASSPAAVNLTIGGNGTSTIYAGVLSGAGSLNKVSAGTVTLANNNTYTGGTTINAGAIQLGDGLLANGSVAGNITDKAALVFANPNSQTFSGVISGTGSVAKTAPGPLTLSGNNSFTGGLSVQQGTLSTATINNAGAGGALGANPSVSLGSIGQTGALEYTGGTASTNMPFVVVGGGSGMFQIDAASTNLSLNGVVSGSGALTKSGAGTLILGANNSFTSGLTINAGMLILGANNSFTGGVTINAGIVRLSNSGALNAGTPNSIRFGPGSSGVLDLGGSGNITISSLQSNSLPGTPIVENANPPLGPLSTLTINDSGTDMFAGVMRDDPGGRGVLAIAKSGSGTLILTGANTYTGGTTINTGTLQLGDGTTSNGSVAGNISDNSGLVFANPNPQVFSGNIFGFGSVIKSAPGTLTFGGNNSFTGGLTVEQGTLVINTINYAHSVGSLGANASVALASSGQTATLEYTGGTASSDMPFTLTTGGNSVFQVDAATTNLTLSGVLSGGGNLTKTGTGTLILTGAHTYTGGTNINGGNLQLGDGATSNGSVVGNISDNAGLIFANPIAQVFSGVILGAGSVAKSAPGALTLGGNNSFTGGLTVQQGTLVINTINNAHTVGSLGASANVNLASSGQTATLEYTGGTASSDMPFTLITGGNSTFQIDPPSASLTLAGILSGGGNLTKAGPGTLILAGNNSYTGGTTVNNGTLTTTAGTLGGGPLAVSSSGGAVAAVSFSMSQSIASLSGTISGGGSASVNVGAGKAMTVNQSPNTTFAGTIALTPGATAGGGGALLKSGIGSLEIDGGLSLGNNSSLAISGGKLRLNITSGSGSVGSGVSANITSGAVLELAGSVSALGTTTPGNRVTITNASSAAAGILVSTGNQHVGDISGSGKTQVNAGANLIADHIIQNALIIGGTSGSHAVVTIAASDVSGNPLGQSNGLALAGSLTASDAFDAGALSSSSLTASGVSSADSSTLSGSDLGGSAAVVPEPTTLILALLGLASVGCRSRCRRK